MTIKTLKNIKYTLLLICFLPILFIFVPVVLSLLFPPSPFSPLKGKLKSAIIIQHDFDRTLRQPISKTMTISDQPRLNELEETLKSVSQNSGSNSLDGQLYKMKVTYTDNTWDEFHFTKREWGDKGITPPQFLQYLEKNGFHETE